ncbi:MAG: metalloprotease PmbA [Pseudomonadota bacterium]
MSSDSSAPADRAPVEANLRDLVERILREARSQGADSAEVSASDDHGLSVNVRRGELETVEFTQERGFGITVYRHDADGVRKGSASTADDREDSIRDTVRAACKIAEFTQPDPCSGLADAELMATEQPDLDLLHPWTPEVDEAAALALECEAAALQFDPRIKNSDGAGVNAYVGTRVYGNSHGFIGTVSGSRNSMSCMVIAEDNAGMQRDYWYTVGRDANAMEPAADVGRTAAERTVARLGSRPISTGRYPILLAPNLAIGLIGSVLSAISGASLYRKSSFLLDSLGQTVTSPHITLREAPHLPGAMGSAAFDGDGVATREQTFIDKGVVSSYILGSYSARRLGLETTGNSGGIHNLIVEGRSLDLPDLRGEMGTGLYVTELMGQGVNLLTGDYSRGAAGFWVENGEIKHPVEEVTIAGTLQEMLKDIVAFGTDVDTRGNIRCGSLLIGGMTVAGG